MPVGAFSSFGGSLPTAPGAGPLMQHGRGFGLGSGKHMLQRLCEQMVVAEPLPAIVQRDQGQVALLEGVQDFLGVGHASNRAAQRRVEPVQHGGVQQELPNMGWLPIDDFPGQEVPDVAMAAGELMDEARGVGPAAQGQGREVDAGWPS
jgi:hypothetical protein